MTFDKRELKGIQLAADSVRQVDKSTFLVYSQSNPETFYKVEWQRSHWRCSCPDYEKHQKKCKHVYATMYYLAIRDVASGIRERYGEVCCPKCGSKNQVIKRGLTYNRYGPSQRYYCKVCRKRFSDRTAFKGLRNKAQIVVTALDLYYRGLSLRQVAEHLKMTQGV
ncbi:MAG: SWIM zinc finger family protein, partial [Nitrososphaerales archaeon]